MAAEGDGSYTETTQIDSDNIKLKEVERPRIKKYFNQGGNFITGVDITSKVQLLYKIKSCMKYKCPFFVKSEWTN